MSWEEQIIECPMVMLPKCLSSDANLTDKQHKW